MNYEEKYKQALESLKKAFTPANGCEISGLSRDCIEQIFPELKESEDERVRKEIIEYLRTKYEDPNAIIGYEYKKWIAWLEKQGKLIEEYEDKLDRVSCESFDKGYKAALEKQGEQRPTTQHKFKIGDTIKYVGERAEFTREEYKIKEVLNDCYLTTCGTYIPFKFEDCYIFVEQKPAWSEEDEKKRRLLISILEVNHPNDYFKVNPANTLNMEAMSSKELVDWLKSLKPRWKPTEEQMEALKRASIVYGEQLESLYNDLKTL